MTIADNIKDLRIKADLTQNQIAEKLNISVQAVSKWERGINLPDVSFLLPLSRLLGVTVDELLDIKDELYVSIYPHFTDKSLLNKESAEKIYLKCEENNFNLESVLEL